MKVCTHRRQIDKLKDFWVRCELEEGHSGEHRRDNIRWGDAASPQAGAQREGGQAMQAGDEILIRCKVAVVGTEYASVTFDGYASPQWIPKSCVLASPPSGEPGREIIGRAVALERSHILAKLNSYVDNLQGERTDVLYQAALKIHNAGFELAHESAKCGHARANYRDPNYKPRDTECDSSKCEFCAALAARASVESGERLREVLREAIKIVEEIRAGGYIPDSFTTQTWKAALATPAPSDGNESARERIASMAHQPEAPRLGVPPRYEEPKG